VSLSCYGSATVRNRDKVAASTGMSGRTLEKASRGVEDAERELGGFLTPARREGGLGR